MLDGGDEVGSLEQALVGAAVEPGDPATEPDRLQLTIVEVRSIHIRDLKLAACRGCQVLGDIDNLIVVEV